jgi:hypothetical protein
MAHCDRFSKMDWCASFNQIAIWPPHRPKTGFITHRGLFVSNVLGFGPTNGPATLQATANVIMGDTLIETHSQYIDDGICHTKGGFQAHVDALRNGLQRLKDGGVKLKAK